MDLSKLMSVVEAAPGRIAALEKEIKEREHVRGALRFFHEAIGGLRTCWRDDDPGKGGAHWFCFHKGKEAWPRELVDVKAVTAHEEHHRARMPNWPDYAVPLAPFAELDRQPCPGCKQPAIAVCKYQQTYDSPGGDEWAKVYYLLCAECQGLYQVHASQSSGRF